MPSNPITSSQIDGGKLETVAEFIFLGSKITADGGYSREIKSCLFLGRKPMINLNSVLKPETSLCQKRSIWSKLWFFSVVMYRFELDHKEDWALKNWWFWTMTLEKTLESHLDSKEINQLILKEINPEYSSEGLMLKLKLQFFSQLMWRADSLEKTLMLRKIEGRRRRG